MHLNLEIYVCRAADEFRAAKRAEHPKAATAHRQLALEYVSLIKCDGDVHVYRMLRKWSELAIGHEPSSPLLALVEVA